MKYTMMMSIAFLLTVTQGVALAYTPSACSPHFQKCKEDGVQFGHGRLRACVEEAATNTGDYACLENLGEKHRTAALQKASSRVPASSASTK